LRTNLGVSDDGLTLAIGTPLSTNDDDEVSAGATKVYRYVSKTWTQLGSAFAGINAGDLLGSAVDVSGDGARVAIGSPGWGKNDDSLGRVAVYQWNDSGETWDQVGSAITGERRYDRLGSSVSLSSDGSIIAIGVTGADGAEQDDSWGEDSGKTRLFQYTSGVWIELGTAPLGEAAGDRAGSAVRLSGDGTRVVVASTGNDGLGVNVDAGAARVYEWTAAPSGTVMPAPPAPSPPPTDPPPPPTSPTSPTSPSPPPSPPPPLTETWRQFGDDVDGAAGESTGTAVSLSRDGFRLAVGGVNVARVLQWTASTWTVMGLSLERTESVTIADDELFGAAVSLSEDGARVAVGSTSDDSTLNNAGRVRVFQWDASGEAWILIGDFTGEAAEDGFGNSVSLSNSGARLAVGAMLNDAGGDKAGHARVFELTDASSWTKMGNDLDGSSANDRFGSAVALSGDGTRIAIGAEVADTDNFEFAGYVSVYEWNANAVEWQQMGTNLFGAGTLDFFGSAISISDDGSVVAASAPYNDGSASDAGHVRVYRWNATAVPPAWQQLGSDIRGDAEEDQFGKSVSLSGDGSRVAIGAPKNDNGDDDAGYARVFIYNTTSADWSEIGTVADSSVGILNGETAGDHFGVTVSLSDDGERVAVGSASNDGGGVDAGHVRVFGFVANAPPPSPPPPPSPRAAANSAFNASTPAPGVAFFARFFFPLPPVSMSTVAMTTSFSFRSALYLFKPATVSSTCSSDPAMMNTR
jgi:hypothetical protein